VREKAAFKMLFHDRASAVGAIAGVVAIVFLVGQQLAIFFGLLSFMSFLSDNSGADIWVLSKNADNPNASRSLPLAYRDRIAGLWGVKWVEPVVYGAGLLKRADGNTQAVQVVGVRRPAMAGGPNRFFRGRSEDLLDGDGVTVDRLDLRPLGNPGIGDVFEINTKRVRVRAITQSLRGFSGNLVFTNIEKAREIAGLSNERCTNLLVKSKAGVPPESLLVVLKRALPRTEAFLSADLSHVTRLYYLKNTGIGSSFGFSTFVGAAVGLVIIALTLYTNVTNKSRDYAMLRALGARRRDVLWIVLLQALYIAGIGMLMGFTLLSAFLTGTSDSAPPSAMPWPAFALLMAGTFLLCLLGSVLAVRRAIRIEPASAFR
jgi:putative ABC transport system permease protein